MALSRVDLKTFVPVAALASRHPLKARDPGRFVTHRAVVAVPNEIVHGKLPVGVHQPLVRTRQEFDAAFTAIQNHVEVPGHVAQVVLQRRRVPVEGGEQQTLVAGQLRDRHQAMCIQVQFLEVNFLVAGHIAQATIVGKCPAMERA